MASRDVSYHSYSDSRVETEAVHSANGGQYPPPEVDEDDLSSVDENYDVASLASSIEDQLTYVCEELARN